MKECYKCGQTKAWDEFNADRSRPDGHSNICKICNRLKLKNSYAKDPEKQKQAVAERRQKHGRYAERSPEQKRERVAQEAVEKAKAEPGEYKVILFTVSETEYIDQQAEELGITPSDFVRFLVRDHRDARGFRKEAEERRKAKEEAQRAREADRLGNL